MRMRRKLTQITALVVATGTLTALSSCADGELIEEKKPEQLGYMLPRPVATTNAGTGLGVATDAEKLSARLYPGAFLAGPNGQLLPNPDLVNAVPEPGDGSAVRYTINEKAQYSDGAPVVCDDFALTQAASSRPDLFGSDMPLFLQVNTIDCAAGAKEFMVHFNHGFGQRYRELFSPGTVLPSHVVGEHAEVPDVLEAINAGDEESLSLLGQAWQETFNVATTDPATVPTHGPYRIASRGDKGQLELVTNDHYAGSKPAESPIYVWPNSADVKQLAADRQVRVADLGTTAKLEKAGLKEPDFQITSYNSGRVDTLRLDSNGMFSSVEMRRAFNACMNRQAMADRISQELALKTTPTGLRMLSTQSPLVGQLQGVSDAQMQMNPQEAGQWLGGQTVRVGYLDAVPRYAALVDEMVKSCKDVGVTVEPVPLGVDNFGALGTDYDVLLDTRPAFGRNAVTNENGLASVGTVKKVEEELHRNMMTISLLTEPRVVAIEQHMAGVGDNGSDAGLSWNMDRWDEKASPVTPTESGNSEPATPANAV